MNLCLTTYRLYAGKIERSDWNVAVIERKMEENKMGRSKARGAERVPKWSREKFADKVGAWRI